MVPTLRRTVRTSHQCYPVAVGSQEAREQSLAYTERETLFHGTVYVCAELSL